MIGYQVPFIIGVPSVRALVLGVIGDDYLLHQEYDTQNDRGEWIHVVKEFQRPRQFIEDYWCDLTGSNSP
jgi:hypothetical protein